MIFLPYMTTPAVSARQLQAGLPSRLLRSLLPSLLCIHHPQWQFTIMNFRNLFLSLFFVLAATLALVQAEDAQPRGPKITHKVINWFRDV